jgi:Tfp pilus assembly protein PilE
MLRSRPGFSFLDMMMYVSLVALSLRYAIPCYHQLVSKIRSHEFIQWAQRAQLEMNEYLLLQQQLPDEWEITAPLPSCISSYDWDGAQLSFVFEESAQKIGTITLSPHIEAYDLSWECDYDGSPAMKTYLCYALSR